MTETDQNSGKGLNGTSKEPGVQKSVPRRILFITVLAALVLLATIWIWKAIEISGLNKRGEIAKQELKAQATSQLIKTHEAHLVLLAKPLVWAFRSDMMQGNLNQVNLYLNDMVKEKGVLQIVIADSKGKIIASTNKKDEGQAFSSVGNANYLTANGTAVESAEGNILIMSSPIMGFNNRLGTLLIRYAVEPPQFN